MSEFRSKSYAKPISFEAVEGLLICVVSANLLHGVWCAAFDS